MPQDRLLHPRLGHSDKVALLTDFEFRVWVQYILSADDFGVMRASAVTLQSENDAIGAKRPAIVQRALEHLIDVRLLRTFEHQNRRYVYQHDWQMWQKVEWPRSTIQPLPPDDVLGTCEESTRELFTKHPGGQNRKKAKHVPNDLERDSQIVPEPVPSLARARPRETANANANGSRLTQTLAVPESVDERAGRLREELYPQWFAKYRDGARLRIPLIANQMEFQEALSLVRTWDDARLEKLAKIVLTTNDSFIAGTDRGFKIFAMKASWADDRLRQAEQGKAS